MSRRKATVAGDSAGGGLTLALLLSLRASGDPMPAGAVLLSPWTDLAMSGWTHVTHGKLEGLPHVFQAFSFLPEARASLAELAAFLRGRMMGEIGAMRAAD